MEFTSSSGGFRGKIRGEGNSSASSKRVFIFCFIVKKHISFHNAPCRFPSLCSHPPRTAIVHRSSSHEYGRACILFPSPNPLPFQLGGYYNRGWTTLERRTFHCHANARGLSFAFTLESLTLRAFSFAITAAPLPLGAAAGGPTTPSSVFSCSHTHPLLLVPTHSKPSFPPA